MISSYSPIIISSPVNAKTVPPAPACQYLLCQSRVPGCLPYVTYSLFTAAVGGQTERSDRKAARPSLFTVFANHNSRPLIAREGTGSELKIPNNAWGCTFRH